MRQYIQIEPEPVFGQPPVGPGTGTGPSAGPSVIPGFAPAAESMASHVLRLIVRRLRPRVTLPPGEVQWSEAIESDVMRTLVGSSAAVVGSPQAHAMLTAALDRRADWVARSAAEGSRPG
jgi:hypothetical protein